jgi:hypothetical protein
MRQASRASPLVARVAYSPHFSAEPFALGEEPPFPQVWPRSRISVDVEHVIKARDLKHAQDRVRRSADREGRALLLDPFAGGE